MRELIEKQAAIDAHCELCGDRNKYFCNSDICPDVEVFQLIPAVQSEPQWIPCSKRLPKTDKARSYWVCTDGGYQCQCRWSNDMYGLGTNEYSEWGWHIMDKPQYARVIAWMPLPEPYIERREDG